MELQALVSTVQQLSQTIATLTQTLHWVLGGNGKATVTIPADGVWQPFEVAAEGRAKAGSGVTVTKRLRMPSSVACKHGPECRYRHSSGCWFRHDEPELPVMTPPSSQSWADLGKDMQRSFLEFPGEAVGGKSSHDNDE